MAPTRGRSPRGQRCRGFAPAGHWRTTTFVCALSTQGLRAPLVLDGPINGAAFRAWVEQFLVPELRPSDIVVMDLPERPQGRRHPGSDRARWRHGEVPAALQSGLQPHRAGLCQAQGDAAKSAGANRRCPLGSHWRIAGPLWQRRMRALRSPLRLLRLLRVRVKLL